MKRGLTVLIPTLIACAAMWFLSPKETLKTVNTITPKLSDIVYSVSAGGKIEQIRAAGLYHSGYAIVDKIYVNPGDEVKKGQVLMTLQPIKAPLDAEVKDYFSEILAQATGYADIKEPSYAAYTDGSQIVSPFDGIVTELGVKETEAISPLTKCAVVSDVSRMQAIVSIPEADILKVKRGMPAGITGDSFAGIYNGVVLEISHQIKSELSIQGEGERYAKAVIELFDADRKLLPGSSVIVKIYTSKKTNVITLPYEAVTQDEDNNEVVYVVKNGRVEKRIVQTGYELSSVVEVKSGISEGDIVILSPPEDLSEGDKVVIRNR